MLAVPPPVPGKPPSSAGGNPEGKAGKPERASNSRTHPRRTRKKHRLPPPVPGAAQASPAEKAAGEFDVELVPTPAAAARGLAISRRDLLAFGLGVGSTLLAILVGWLFALLFRKRKPDGDGNSE
jgi:hypothetical protein